MGADTACDSERYVKRHILIAVDTSANSKRAVQYVGDFFGCYPGFRVTLLHVILLPSPGFFADASEEEKWLGLRMSQAEKAMRDYQNILVDSGFKRAKVEARIETGHMETVGDFIIAEQEKMKCCVVVIGRRGISKKEEFIFGSTSNKVLHEGRNCAVLVIE